MSEAVVIGGGLAGGAVATLLARAGREVTLIEREASPVDKVCGEFLSFQFRGEECSLEWSRRGRAFKRKVVARRFNASIPA